MTFYWLTPFTNSFSNSDWLELEIYFFQTNELDGEQNAFMVNFSDNSDLRRGFKPCLRDFWERHTFQEEQQKAIEMFFEGKDVSV